MSVTLKRHAKLEDVTVAAITGLDGQGKPTYGTPVVIKASVLRQKAITRSNNAILMQPGDQTDLAATVWIDAGQSYLPRENDRVTLADGLICVVVEMKERKSLQAGQLDHVRLKLREE